MGAKDVLRVFNITLASLLMLEKLRYLMLYALPICLPLLPSYPQALLLFMVRV
jgi:hypothetical protein